MEIKLNDVSAYVDTEDLADELVGTETFTSGVRDLVEQAVSDTEFVTSGDLDDYADADHEHADYVDEDTVREMIAEEMPDLDDYATESYVDDAIRDIDTSDHEHDDYVTWDGLANRIEEEMHAQLLSLPDDPDRRCYLGQAFAKAVESVVRSSDTVQALVEMAVGDALAAQAQSALDAEWDAAVAALPVAGVVASVHVQIDGYCPACGADRSEAAVCTPEVVR